MPAATGDQQAPRPQEVFISYSRKDKEFVRQLDEELRRRDREAWVDWEGIPPGDTWEKTIYGAIESTHTFIFVLTPDSIASEVCGKEAAHAAANNKRLVPIVHRDIAADRVPKSLRELNWIFCRDSDDFAEATDTLIRAMDTDLKWVRAHTRLLTRAIEWENKGKSDSFVLRGDDLRAAEQWLTEAGAQKERQPTALQTEYIISSRKAAARRQRITLGAVSFGLVVAIVLALLAWQQWTKALKTLSRSYFQEACGLIDDDRAPEALAYLARALEVDPSNRPAAIRLLTLLVQRNWILPVTEPLPHDQPVVAASFNSDESKLLTESGGMGVYGYAQVWEVPTGRPLTAQLHSGVRFTRGNFSPSGQALVTWNTNYFTAESIVSVWRTTDGANIGDVALGQSARFVGDDAHLAVSDGEAFGASDISELGGLRIARGNGPVREPTGTLGSTPLIGLSIYKISPDLKTLTPQDASGFASVLGFSPSGQRLLASGKTNGLQVRDTLGTRSPVELQDSQHDGLAQFLGEDRVVSTSHMDTEAQSSADAGGEKNILRIWSAESGELIRPPLTRDGALKALDLSAENHRVLIANELEGGSDATTEISVFQTGVSDPLWTKKVFEGFQAAFLDSAGRDVISFRQETTQVICSRDRLQTSETKSFKVNAPVLCAVFEPNSNTLFMSTRKDGLRLWDMANTGPLGEALRADGDLVNVAVAPTRHFLATGSRNHTARLWDPRPSASLASPLFRSGLNPPSPPKIETPSLRFVDGENLNRNEITQKEGTPLWSFTHEAGFRYRFISFSADGSLLVAVSNAAEDPLVTNSVTVYEARTGKVLAGPHLIREQTTESKWAGLSPGNKLLALVSGDIIYLWDLTRKGSTDVFREFHVGGKVVDVSFSPDRGELFVRTEPGEVAQWDIESAQRLSDLQPVSGNMNDSYDLAWRRLQALKSTPHWMVDLAGAVCGFELRDNHLAPIANRVSTLRRLSQELDKAQGDNLYAVFAKWFFADRAKRPIAPNHEVATSDFIEKKLAENDEVAVRQAEIAASFDSAVLAKARARRAEIENASPTQAPERR
jgi:WD40 repeat protein